MKNERIECTLQEAIELCENQGGRFHSLRINTHDKWWIVADDGSVVKESIGEKFQLTVVAFSIKWIYEPPKRSAFQEWHDRTFSNDVTGQHISRCKRKEGWNAAIDAVLKMVRHDDNFIADYDIETLREP